MDRRLGFAVAVILVLAAAALYLSQKPKSEPIHIHADFKVYLDGTAFNFSQEKYMSEENGSHDAYFHLHEMDGNVLHQHMSGLKLSRFFESLNMSLNSSCFVSDGGDSHCNGDGKTLEMRVKHAGAEWQRNYEFGSYEMQDVDMILITYGAPDEGALKTQMDSVTDLACMYSEKCPERGKPPNEKCAGDEEEC